MRWAWRRFRRALAPGIRPDRLLLAAKAAIAAGLAWPIAQLLPGSVDEYSYYAPLGALLSMMPTLAGSLRTSLQSLLGLATGIGLAFLVILSPLPGLISVPLAVGLGVLVGSLRSFGAGGSWVSITALFVLVIGGSHAGDYSLGYLVQMGVGMLIGFVVNLVIAPPLRSQNSSQQISALRREIAKNLDGMSEALVESWPPEHHEWFDGMQTLVASVRAAEPIIEDARDSRRMNPRATWHHYDVQEDFDDLNALTQLGRHTRDLGEAISAAIWSDPVPLRLAEGVRTPLSRALSCTAALVRAGNDRSGMEQARREVERSLDDLGSHDRSAQPREPGSDIVASVIFTIKRMLAVVEARTDPPSA